MRKKNPDWMRLVVIGFLLLAMGCSGAAGSEGSDTRESVTKQGEVTDNSATKDDAAAATLDVIRETISEETTPEATTEPETTPEETTQDPYAMIRLPWTDPQVELGETYDISLDPKTYVQLAEDTLYQQCTVSHTVDLANPGEYQIEVVLGENTETFAFTVKDTVAPVMTMEYEQGFSAVGERIDIDSLIKECTDADSQMICGFYEARKACSIEEFMTVLGAGNDVYQEMYNQTLLPAIDALQSHWTFEEEGVYVARIVAADRSGNATTGFLINIVDGTAPTITFQEQNVILSMNESYNLMEGVSCHDNIFGSQCSLDLDKGSYNALLKQIKNGIAGTYELVYVATDYVGNRSTAVRNITFTVPKPAYMEDMARECFDLINQYRTQAGLSALVWDDTIYEATKIRSNEVSVHFDHNRLDGTKYQTVFPEVGIHDYEQHYRAENIAKGQTSAQMAAEDWYNSPGHHANLMGEHYTRSAVGCYYTNGTYHWCQLFMD